MKHFALIAVAAILVPLTGCGGRNAHRGGASTAELKGRVPAAPKQPPAVRPAKDVPLDPALASAARAELAQALRSKDATLRANAREAMRAVPDDVSRQEILKALEDEEPIVRFSAAMAAGELRLSDAKQPLLAMVDDPDPNVGIAV